MEIVYCRDIGFIYDICGILFCLSNEREIWEKQFVLPSKKQEDSEYIERILAYFEKVQFSKKLMGVQSKDHLRLLLSELYENYYTTVPRDSISINDFGLYMANPERLKKEIIAWYFDEKLNSNEEVLDRISLLSCDAKIKAELYDVVLFPESYAATWQKEYCELCAVMEKVYEDFYDIEKGKMLIQQMLYPEDSVLERILGEKFRQHSSCYLGINIVEKYTTWRGMDCHDRAIWAIGIGIQGENFSQISGEQVILENFAHALGDKTRMQILLLIQERGAMTMAELAKELNLANTVVMYHLDILKKAYLLMYHASGRRVIYRLNKEYIRKNIEELKKLLK